MSFLEERDLVGLGRDARDWLLQDREMARRGREARAWLTQDERGRVISLVLLSVALSIAVSLMATAVVGLVSRRRTAVADDAATAGAIEQAAGDEPVGDEPVGVPVMMAEVADEAPEATEVVEAAPA